MPIPAMLMMMTFQDPGDERSFKQFVSSHGKELERIAFKILNNKSDAEDACQEALIKLYLNFDKYKGLGEKRLLLLGAMIVKRCAIDIYRENHKRSNETISIEENEEAYEIVHLDELPDNDLAIYMTELKESDRELLMLRYSFGYGADEIADILGITKQGVYKKIKRAKERLTRIMADDKDE